MTSPTGMPRYSTSAPGWRPRTRPSKWAVSTSRVAGLVLEEVLAGGALGGEELVDVALLDRRSGPEPTVSKETPPWSSEIRLSTLSEAPPPPRLIEKPLAFQKRVLAVRRALFGALTKTSIITSPASVRVMSSTWPTWMRLKSTGRADGHRAAVGGAQADAEAGLVGGGERRRAAGASKRSTRAPGVASQ